MQDMRVAAEHLVQIRILVLALLLSGCDRDAARGPDFGKPRTLRIGLCSKDPDCPPLTNRDLERVGGYDTLAELYIKGSEITDEGLKHLSDLTNLRVLELDTPQVTDAGLEHLLGLERLLVLKLVDTQVTEQGIERFEEAVPACHVRVKRTPVPAGGADPSQAGA